jgi:hypothetical protein
MGPLNLEVRLPNESQELLAINDCVGVSVFIQETRYFTVLFREAL